MTEIKSVYVFKRKLGSEWLSFAVTSQENANLISKAFKQLQLEKGVIVMECHLIL